MTYEDIKPKILILKPVMKPYEPDRVDVLRQKRKRGDRGGGSSSAPPAAPAMSELNRSLSTEEFLKGVSQEWSWFLLKNSASKFQDRGLRG